MLSSWGCRDNRQLLSWELIACWGRPGKVTCTTDKVKYCCTECPERRCQIGDVKRMVGDMQVEAPWRTEALRWCCSKGACWGGEAEREMRSGRVCLRGLLSS